MRNSIDKLHNSSYGIFFIGHTKLKKKNTGLIGGDELDYMQLSCNLTDDFASVFEDMADMITYLVLDKEVDESITDAKKRTSTNKVSMHFRSDGSIDCGGRFVDLPYSLPYSAENYLKAFEQGVKSSILKPVTDIDIKKMAISQEKDVEEKIKQIGKKLSIEEMLTKIKSNFNELGDGGRAKLQEYIAEADVSGYDDFKEEHREVVEKMYDLVS